MTDTALPPNHYYHRGMLLNTHYPRDYMDKVLDTFKFKETDIILATYVRSGTLLTQEIIWHIKNRNSIKKGEKYDFIFDRFPYIELDYHDFGYDFVDLLNSRSNDDFRLIKTHMPQHILQERVAHCQKIVIVSREAKDVAVSLYYFYKSFTDFENWPPSWDEFYEYFISGRVMYGSYFEWNVGWLRLKDLPNIHVIKYENLIANKVAEIKRLANFLDAGDITEDQVDIIIENTKFENMKTNSKVNIPLENDRSIMRKGQVGDWKEYFSEKQRQITDCMTKKYLELL